MNAKEESKATPDLRPESALQATALSFNLRMREFEALALAVDHLNETNWDYPKTRKGRPLDGGILWHKIDGLNAKLVSVLEGAW